MIYFDNAATTWPKPTEVQRAMVRAMNECGGNPGRSSHRLSVRASEEVFLCRKKVASLFGAKNPTCVVFTPNATQALNLAIRCFAEKGKGILLSDIEHNSVLRPAHRTGCPVSFYRVAETEGETAANFDSALSDGIGLVVASHHSNLCGLRNPIEEIGKRCREKGVRFVADLSQSAGSEKIDLSSTCADCLCSAGHKGLFGPMGTGFALFADRYADERESASLPAFLSGGNGIATFDREMPPFLPERFETGTLPVPALAGLSAGISFVSRYGEDLIREKLLRLDRRLKENLSLIEGIEVYLPDLFGGIVLFSSKSASPSRLTALLDEEGFALRSGFHCAPTAHEKLGTAETGAIRASFSLFNTEREVDRFSFALERLLRNLPG